MADLRVLIESIGFKDVKTYIQSGNIVLKDDQFTEEQIKAIIEQKIEHNYSFNVETFVFEANDFKALIEKHKIVPAEINREEIYFSFFSKIPKDVDFKELKTYVNENEKLWLDQEIMFSYYKLGAGRAKINNKLIENKLHLRSTARNWRTVHKLIDMSDDCRMMNYK